MDPASRAAFDKLQGARGETRGPSRQDKDATRDTLIHRQIAELYHDSHPICEANGAT
jgi:hypothetical protein